MITSRLDKSKHFELVFRQIGGLEPDLWILEDLDIFGVFVVISFFVPVWGARTNKIVTLLFWTKIVLFFLSIMKITSTIFIESTLCDVFVAGAFSYFFRT